MQDIEVLPVIVRVRVFVSADIDLGLFLLFRRFLHWCSVVLGECRQWAQHRYCQCCDYFFAHVLLVL